MNPKFPLPKCSSTSVLAGAQAGHFASSGVFIACGAGIAYGGWRTCLSVLDAIVKAKTGVTVNLFVWKDDVPDPQWVERTKSVAKMHGSTINLIPLDQVPFTYPRDTAIFSMEPSGFVANMLPDTMEGAPSVKSGLARCEDISVKASHLKDAKLEGGNTLALPGGDLLLGNSHHRPISHSLADTLSLPRGAVVDLPAEGGIGHIDEIFSVVPSTKNACGYAILSASPDELKTWASKYGGWDTALSISNEIEGTARPQVAKMQSQFDEINERVKLKTASHSDLRKAASLRKRIRLARGMRIMSWHDVLHEPAFIDSWQEQQNQITALKEVLWKRLPKSACAKEQVFIDIPMAWVRIPYEGQRKDINSPLFQNPVNGLHLNGTYFISRLNIEVARDFSEQNIAKQDFFTENSIEELHQGKLQKFIVDSIQSRTGLEVIGINTWDATNLKTADGGNLHCLTLNIPLPCDPN